LGSLRHGEQSRDAVFLLLVYVTAVTPPNSHHCHHRHARAMGTASKKGRPFGKKSRDFLANDLVANRLFAVIWRVGQGIFAGAGMLDCGRANMPASIE
jgi:hypothetical protein